MIKVRCEACGAPYDVDPRRIPAAGLKMRCPACGTTFHVHPLSAHAPEGAPGPSTAQDALDLDLPAPKGAPLAPGRGRPGGPLGASPPARKPDDFADLPAVKGRTGSLPDNLADDLLDPSGPGGVMNPGMDFDLDLPAAKAFDLDLPAPKTGTKAGPQRPSAAAGFPAPTGPSPRPGLDSLDDLDLPAPKAPAPVAFTPRKPSGTRPFAAVPLDPVPASTGGFDLDLPAPKPRPGQPASAPQPSARAQPGSADHSDLPALKGSARQAPLAPEVDLPTLKTPAPRGPLVPDFDVSQPAPKGAPERGHETSAGYDSFDLDLPAFKGAAPLRPAPERPAAPQKSFSKPAAADPSAPKHAGNLPKDSLALEPSAMFSGQRANGALGDLDDVHISFGTGSSQHVDLPAPSNLPAVHRGVSATGPRGEKAARGTPQATMLGLGMGKLPKDSLDLPRGFEGAPEASPFDDQALLPAPSNLPIIKPQGPTRAGAESHGPGDLDLPAPADLPVKKKAPPGGATMLGLGSLGKEALGRPKEPQVPVRQEQKTGIGEMLDESLETAGNPGGDNPFGNFELELDLPPKRPTQDLSGPIELEKLSLPSAESMRGAGKPTFGATMALGADDIELGDSSGQALSLGDDDPFGSLGGSSKNARNNATIELDSVLDFGAPSRDQGANARSHNNFGELDFGLDDNGPKTGGLPLVQPRPMPVPMPAVQASDNRVVEADLVGRGTEHDSESPARKKKKVRREARAVPGFVWPVLVVAVVGVAGVGLGMFTNHGYFGVYLLEQLLPAAGDPAQVAAAIGQAEKTAKSDTYVDVRKSLTVLSDARNEAGLNRALLARSLLHEALYQLRFGEDAQSAQRSVAILARALERGADSEGLTLARAADAARRGALPEADALLAQVPSNDDPHRALVAGEIALLKKAPEAALEAFNDAHKKGAGARASWGATRASIALGKLEEADAGATRTLAESPAHSGALTFLARRAFARGDTKSALDYVQKATGSVKLGEQRARPSRHDRADAWALAGQIYQRLDHPREAQAAYEASLAADPLRPDSLIGSGTMLMRLGRARDALSRFDSALGAHPSTAPDALGSIPMVEATVGAVQALLVLERASEALPRITALSTKYPDDPTVTLALGQTLEAADKLEEAEAAFAKTIELAPAAFPGYVALSQLLFKKGRPEEGARILSDATGKVKDSAEVRRMLGYSELTRNHLPEAIHQFRAALHFDAGDTAALLGLTTAQRKAGNIAEAEKTLAKLEQVDPTVAGIPLERGQLLEARGDASGAADAYRKALGVRAHDTDLKLRLGAALVNAGRLDEADAILPEVLKERPTSAEAEHFVGRLLFAKRETAQAVQHFERAIAFDALQAEYHLYLGWAYLDQGNLGAALASVNKALDRDPNLGDARWILGRIQLRTGAVKDALASFQQTLKLKPGRVEALANMGDAHDQLRDLGAAIRAYQEAVRQLPENGDWWYKLGTLHLDKGSRDEARVALAEAVLRGDRLMDKPPWLADAHRMYAEVLRDSGRGGEALEHYRMFLTLASPSHPDRAEIERIMRTGQRR